MKNIHVLSTEKPSRLLRGLDGIRLFENEVSPDNQWCVNVNIHITNDEELKDGDKRINNYQRKPKGEEIPSKKIILTTDQDLIKDGVQGIDDEFLEWFVKNPSCEYVDLIGLRKEEGYEFLGYEIIIPKEEPKQELNIDDVGISSTQIFTLKQETLEEAAERFVEAKKFRTDKKDQSRRYSFIQGAKWQQEQDKNKYSEEEVVSFIHKFIKEHQPQLPYLIGGINMWFEQFKKK